MIVYFLQLALAVCVIVYFLQLALAVCMIVYFLQLASRTGALRKVENERRGKNVFQLARLRLKVQQMLSQCAMMS